MKQAEGKASPPSWRLRFGARPPALLGGLVALPSRIDIRPIIRQSDIQSGGFFMEAAKVGKRGAVVVPARLRRQFGIEEGSIVTAEAREDGILIRPAVVIPVEKYSPARKAEFLLSNATTAKDYRRARKEVQALGLDPDAIPHRRPKPR